MSDATASSAGQAPFDSFPATGLPIERRFIVLALLLALEGLLIFVHIRDANRTLVATWGCACASIFVAVAYPRIRQAIQEAAGRVINEPLSWRALAGHAVAMVLFLALGSPRLVNALSGATSILVLAAWCVAGVAGVASAALIFMPLPVWLTLLRRAGNAWVYAVAGAFIASAIAPYLWLLWDRLILKSAIAVTFAGVRLLIGAFLPDMVADPVSHVIGSSRFEVVLNGECSGWEGVGLAFTFSAFWLWVTRREMRFPRAFLLIPGSMVIMFGLNTLRIAALIFIGNAVSPRVAMSGFHSQAGWIMFNVVALGIAWITPKIGWLTLRSQEAERPVAAVNRTVPYLLPFAAILAAGMVSKATSAGFEWLYPLRFFAAAVALWHCRREYRSLQWRPGWLSVLAGGVVFVIWFALDRGSHADNGIAAGLAAIPQPARIAWIFFRVLAAVSTVPLAEELAFRGFLLRRFVSPEFESVDFTRFTWPALIGSSLLFGLMHGEQWFAGTFAGALYAGVMLRRGRIGDAVAAHAVTNALLAVCVLWGRSWYLW